MPKTLSVAFTFNETRVQIVANQPDKTKKENPGSLWNRDSHLQIQF